MKKIGLSIFVFLLAPGVVLAQTLGDVVGKPLEQASGRSGANLRGTTVNLQEFVGDIIAVFLSFLGVYFLARMVYAGFLWFTAQGNQDQTKRAKMVITQSIIGFIIVLTSALIVYSVVQLFS